MKTSVLSKSYLVILLCLAQLVLQSCGGGTNLAVNPDSWNFSISGDPIVGDSIKFISTAPDNSIFEWTFGDGHSSTQASPYHVYTSIAYDKNGQIIDDTVVLVINNDIYHSVIKPVKLLPPVTRVSHNWAWKGGYFKKYGNCCPGVPDHALSDTTFTIARIDDYVINTWGVNLPFLPDSNFFGNAKTAIPYNATSVTFTPDTLFFRQSSGDSMGGAVITYFHKF